MTPTDVITEARKLIQDTATPYRYSDDALLGYVNQTLKRIAMVRPDLFAFIGEIPTTADVTFQTCPADSVRLVEIFQIKDGNAVTEVSRETLDQSNPGWPAVASGTPVNYMRHPRNPNRYFLYPRPASGVTLIAEYVQSPPDYTALQDVDLLPDSYLPLVVDGTVFLAESEDNEHVNSGRADKFLELFTGQMATSQRQRTLTDREDAAVDGRAYASDPRGVVD
jgi:hypothetical protein